MNSAYFSSCSCSRPVRATIPSAYRVAGKQLRASSVHAAPRRDTFFFFDPENPENIVEVKATGQRDLPARVPKAMPPQISGGAQAGLAPPQVGKLMKMQEQLAAQLDVEREKVMRMQKYEGQYKEWRVMADQLSQEVDVYQKQLYEKDVELNKAYKKLETSAEERVALRKANLELKELAEKMSHQLAITKNQIQGSTPPMALPSSDGSKQNPGGKMSDLIKMWPH